jgi:hypothetical protein
MRTNHNSHPGVTLLFTISMIVLFLLMGTTFMVVANDYFKNTVRRSRLNTYKVDATQLLDQAFENAFRGPSMDDASSPLRGHSILADQYGYGISGSVSDAAVGPGTAFVTLTAALAPTAPNTPDTFTETRDGSTIDFVTDLGYFDGLYNGRVLTITDGETGVGYSTRIVSHRFDTTTTSINFIIPRDRLGVDWTAITATDKATVLINGRDFAGTGAGAGNFSLTSIPDPDTTTPSGALNGNDALFVNKRGENRMDITDSATGYLSIDFSVNEPYDIADFQNMFLSGRDKDGNIIPSFHRDTLHDYLFTTVGRTAADEIRGYTFRPLHASSDLAESTANDEFPSMLASSGNIMGSVNDEDNYDVDNTLDGTKDSVWIDIGLPIQTDSQGRQFRPLVAYHIVDLDGNLNLNAHGSFADSELGAGTRRGSGYGVAEISLAGIMGTDYDELLNDRSDDDGDRSTNDDSGPGVDNSNVLQTSRKLFGFPLNTAPANNPNNVGSGFFSTGGDILGQFTLERQTTTGFGEDSLPEFNTLSVVANTASRRSPYNADFSINGGIGDQHFGATDLEGMIRGNDIDSSLLYSRLSETNYSSLYTNENQHRVTTHSFEVAMPAYPVTAGQLLRRELENQLSLTTPDQIRMQFKRFAEDEEYLSREIFLGGKFNLNRPFGDGVDQFSDITDPGAGTYDDPLEVGTIDQTHPDASISETFDLDNRGDGRTGDNLARQQMAKQLYILALLVCGQDKPVYVQGAETDEDYRKMVAQWAVNVVDFQDSDSIITVFEYDINPFNATLVDGDPITNDTDRGLVYGMERPELVFTESSAQHIRLTEDLDTEVDVDQADGDSDGETTTDSNPDLDWDSQRRPQSSAFIELHNPWAQSTSFQRYAAELGNITDGVNLADSAPSNGSDGITPVWRIAAKRVDTGADNDNIIRTIYFRDPSTNPTAIPTTSSDNFFPSFDLDANPRFMGPGDYMVVGGSGNFNETFTGTADRNLTTFGRRIGGFPANNSDLADSRSIELFYDDASGTSPARILDRVEINNPGSGTVTRDCQVAVIDMPRSLSLSDPDGDYPQLSSGLLSFVDEIDGRTFTPVADIPWDSAAATEDFAAIFTNGVTEDFRVLHLQRLADPTQPWEMDANPYVSIDKINVDLLAFNGLARPTGAGANENVLTGGTAQTVTPGTTEFRTIERAESGANNAIAKRQFFKIEEGMAPTAGTAVTGDDHFFNLDFEETLGSRNDSVSSTDPMGWLVWNNRPFANVGELMNVPYGSHLETLARFNSEKADFTQFDAMNPNDSDNFGLYISNDQFGHLIAYGGCDPTLAGGGGSTATELTPNRFDRILEFVEVPNLFLGSEAFITPLTKASSVDLNVGFNAPFNTIPNFRYPGKINLNTMSPIKDPTSTPSAVGPTDARWTATKGGFGDALNFGRATAEPTTYPEVPNTPYLIYERDYAEIVTGPGTSVPLPTDFGGYFTTSVGGELVPPGVNLERKGESLMFRRTRDDMDDVSEAVFDNQSTANTRHSESSPVFKNELRQRLSATTTTRSSVFAIWITVGYFEVDEFGRVGAEIGSDEGTIQRNRAFYMVDRSIPVACEPGKNHNVDQAVLVRTIIE